MRWTRITTVALLCFFSAACGKSGERDTRPIEVTFYVNRPSGVPFEVVALQGANADHRLSGEEFETPHLFVLENLTQPARGVFRNLDPEQPLIVELAFGPDIVNRQEIPPGICCVIEPGADCSKATEDCGEIAPQPMRREVRFDIASVSGPVHIGYSATLGDEEATNITGCTLGSDICLTPSTFFLEDAKNHISGVFTKFSDQDPDAVFRVDLYVDGVLRDSDSDKRDVVVAYDL